MPVWRCVSNLSQHRLQLGTEESSAQILTLEADLSSTTKEGKSMATWLTALYEIFSQLSILENPRPVAQNRLQIDQSLKSDPRYEHVIRDVKRNTAWSVVKIRSALEAHAASINDLLEGPTHKAETKRMAKVAYRKARAALESDASDSDALEPKPEPEHQPSKNSLKRKAAKAKAKKLALAAKAHPPPANDKPAAAEGPKLSVEERDALKKEACVNFRIGTCRNGDSIMCP